MERVFKMKDKNEMKIAKTMTKICSDEPTRKFLNFIHFDVATKNFVATDGCSMLVVSAANLINENNNGLDHDGYFELSGDRFCEIKDQGKYPDFRRAVPTNSVLDTFYDYESRKGMKAAGRIPAPAW